MEVKQIQIKAPGKSVTALKQAIVAILSNQRKANAQVKTRGEVRGGGKKPWRQKGLGRARVGSSRTPVWRGGGVVFGPSTMRNFTKKTNAKEGHLALTQALSVLAENNRLLQATTELSATKTRDVVAYVASIPDLTGTATLVSKDANAELTRAAANSKLVQVRNAQTINLYDIVTAHTLVFLPGAWEAFQTRLTKEVSNG